MNGYELSKKWFDWAFENPEKVTIGHTAVFFFTVEWCNRLSWKEKFGLPTSVAMEALGIKKHDTYTKYFNDLVEWGFISLIQKAKNQHTSNIVSLNCAYPKSGEALGLANRKHGGQQLVGTGVSTGSIDKPITPNLEPETNTDAIALFESFRVKFPGTKGGHETELKRFQKHKDWKVVAPSLMERLEAEIADRREKQKRNAFVPQWTHLSTYLNQRRWEAYEPANIPEPTADYKIDLSLSYEKDRELGMKQIHMMCYTIGYRNCNKRELQWAYDWQRPYDFVSDPYKPNELLLDRGLPGTQAEPNTVNEVLQNG
jgi:hypothetical protein